MHAHSDNTVNACTGAEGEQQHMIRLGPGPLAVLSRIVPPPLGLQPLCFSVAAGAFLLSPIRLIVYLGMQCRSYCVHTHTHHIMLQPLRFALACNLL